MKNWISKTKRMRIINGDCLAVLDKLPDNCIDTIITDPPYNLTANKKGGTGTKSLNLKHPAGRSRITTGGGFMGMTWDATGIAFKKKTWRKVLRVLKPGGYLLAFGGTRTYHRMTCAIEDAGFDIKDSLQWIYGQGFAKGRNLTSGYSTQLKPAYEPIVMAMKPLDGTYANNFTKWGVAGLNIAGCRIPTTDNLNGGGYSKGTSKGMWTPGAGGGGLKRLPGQFKQPEGRWPANVILDEDAGKLLDQQAPKTGAIAKTPKRAGATKNAYGKYNKRSNIFHEDGLQGASRFFYCAKSSKKDRGEGNTHPTVKPTALMEYLCKLTRTPTGGIVLDPFMGSGTTGIACLRTGRKFVGIEINEDYFKTAKKRIIHEINRK